MQQLTLFPETATPPSQSKKKETYEEFVDKFKPKLTTDDCYTPAPVYDVVLQWVRRNCNIEGCNIIRPFYPGGDFEAMEYEPNDVVVDNPPFSILTRIVRWYMDHGIRFFLFAPYLTCFHPGRFCTSVVTDMDIIYENGAKINTSFVSNMFGDIRAMSAPDLGRELEAVQMQGKVPLPRYKYPDNVIRSSDLGRYSRYGIRFTIPKSEARFITKLDSQRGKASIFGGGYLISDRIAAIRSVADKTVQTELACIEWAISDRERRIIDEELNPGT